MEEQEQQLPTDYKKGFNDAWRLSEDMPQLFNGLSLPKGHDNEYNKGFDDGRNQFVKERTVQQIQEKRQNEQKRGHGL